MFLKYKQITRHRVTDLTLITVLRLAPLPTGMNVGTQPNVTVLI